MADQPTFRDRALVLGDALVVADLHLGRGAASAVEAPVPDGEDVVDRLGALVRTHDPETLVLAGDVLHAFDTVPAGVRSRLRAVETLAAETDTDLVTLEGNHDAMLGTLWDGPVADSHHLDGSTVAVHGHESPAVTADRYVIGHDHPTIEIEGRRRPCWLVGPGGPDGADLIVLPSFTRFAPGVAVNGMDAAAFQSPLVTDADALAPVVWDDEAGETLRFPPLGEFRHRLR